MYQISESDESFSETEDHISYASDFNSDSDDAEEMIIKFSKNENISWNSKPIPKLGQTSTRNIIKNLPGLTKYACVRVTDIKSSFSLFFQRTMEKVLKMSNIEGRNVYGSEWKDLDIPFIQSYIGLLILAGVYKSHGESTKSLWNAETGRSIFPATMSLKSFSMISRILRFDDKETRKERRNKDKLAAIREIYESWNDNLSKMYYPDEYVTVDEQLVGFRGRCPFKQYIPSKPAKYGIKIWTLCDSKSSYVLNTQVYTGKEKSAAPEKNQGTRVVLDLTKDLKGHNVTIDNFFTSYNLGQELLKRKLTMLGTIRKNKNDLPKFENKDVFSSEFFFTKDTTVVNYVPKKYRNVILMSTFHADKAVSDNSNKMKPIIILDYNSTKGAVDTLDQAVATYTCKRKTNRWPMILFYNMIDVSAFNAYVIWTSINPSWNKNMLTRRRLYLEELGKSFLEEFVIRRKTMPRSEHAKSIVKNMKRVHAQSLQIAVPESLNTDKKRARCGFCKSNSDNKTNMVCKLCRKFLCKQHVCYLCINCEK